MTVAVLPVPGFPEMYMLAGVRALMCCRINSKIRVRSFSRPNNNGGTWQLLKERVCEEDDRVEERDPLDGDVSSSVSKSRMESWRGWVGE